MKENSKSKLTARQKEIADIQTRELKKALAYAKKAKQKKFFIESYVVDWSILESFLLPINIEFLSKICNIKIPKDQVGRSVRTDIEIFYILSREDGIRSELIAQKKVRDELFHELSNTRSFHKVSFNERKDKIKREMKKLNKIILTLAYFLSGERKPKIIKDMDKIYKQGANRARAAILNIIRKKMSTSIKKEF